MVLWCVSGLFSVMLSVVEVVVRKFGKKSGFETKIAISLAKANCHKFGKNKPTSLKHMGFAKLMAICKWISLFFRVV